MRIKLTYPISEFVQRQTPGELGVWDDAHFITGDTSGTFDGWVVYEHLPFPQTLHCDPNRTAFVTGEPASVRKYDARFLAQFAAVVSPQEGIDHPRVFVQQPAIPWWVGVQVSHQPGKSTAGYSLNYDKLKALTSIGKPKLASVICSTKSMTEGHHLRLRLLESLRKQFADTIDFFGHGFEPIADKWDAIAPYRYHVVLENGCTPHYWTEKLADAYLAGAFPIYSGCPNVGDYFPTGSFRAIDPRDPVGAIAVIGEVLREDRYADVWPLIREARERVLDRYNLYPMLCNVLKRLAPGMPRMIRIRREQDFTDPPAVRYRRMVRRLIYGTGPRSG